MQGILLATAVAALVALVVTPFMIEWFTRRGVGQIVRVDGPTTHLAKQGTPTMGGLMILLATTLGYAASHVRIESGALAFRPFQPAGLLVLGATLGMGLLGAIDDVISIRQSRSLGLTPQAKLAGQALVGFGLAYGAMHWAGVRPTISWTGLRDVPGVPELPTWAFAAWVVVILWGTTNAVNITDGLDGLASGSSAFAMFVYAVIAFWEFRNPDVYRLMSGDSSGLLDVSIMAAALLGGTIGFLWWNAHPARVIMGDTGAFGLGGALGALALLTRTQLLLLVIAGLFAAEFASSLIQRYVYKITKRFFPDGQGRGRRVFAMAPLHHHFEMKGWQEITVTVRFWLVAGVLAGAGLALFYTDFLAAGGAD